ncbi:substrate-binding domain-containing protein [Hydrogenoanaerobacterium sp.]|uniref:substrate-binding domain-containing protein n=1 Tax=Hydrogenoanaerobacterium sp. TaxID=2953763 RepID=UPI00289AF0A3|nr:substrate-binding domain-containing protein [Hydrogenoanaerobacterium sp.]
MKRTVSFILSLILAMSLTACKANNAPSVQPSDISASSESSSNETPTEDPVLTTIPGYANEQGEFAKGPNGETAVSADTVTITEEQYAQIKEKKLKAAMLWAGASEWYNAMTDGAKAEFEKMGIEIVAISDAQFDPAKQATDIETTMAVKPDILLSLPVDPVSGTRAYQPAVDAGTKIVFADNGVNSYKADEQYVSIVTGDQYGMGRAAAELMAESIGGKGKIGVIFYDVDFLVTNNRDNEFVRTIKKNYPDIEIAAITGFSEESATGDVAATMLTQHPDLDGIYVAWDVAAEPVVAELRAAGKKDVKVVTIDLGGNNDLDMAQGGNVYGKVADMPYQIGATMAKLAALNILGEKTPAYVVSGTVEMTKENMAEAWRASLNKDPDANVLKALDK